MVTIGETVMVALSASPHGELTRTQNCVGAVIAGVISDGAIVRGTSGFAGEVGHIPLGDPAARCGCGRRGCWEASVGLRAVLAAVGVVEDGTPLEAAEAVSRRAATDERTAEVLDGIGMLLGKGVATMANISEAEGSWPAWAWTTATTSSPMSRAR